MKYRESENDEWQDDHWDFCDPSRLAQYLGKLAYEGQAICDWKYRVQIRDPNGSERWLTVTADIEFTAYED